MFPVIFPQDFIKKLQNSPAYIARGLEHAYYRIIIREALTQNNGLASMLVKSYPH